MLKSYYRFCLVLLFVNMIAIRAFRFSTGPNFKIISALSMSQHHTMIKVQHTPPEETIIKAATWPTWSCHKSKFSWYYDETEVSYIVKGSAIVTPVHAKDGPPTVIKAGDYCTFESGLECTWEVTDDILKHYHFY